ncbi:hypothetical protein MNY66_16895 (plasmid) [Moellerella wisconsensis]|uniref:Uncharacterized protein n=2 Tax=Enterobacterales TaxID=91347 RepID=A0ACD3YDJ3_9GAMM|nr:MULTISPECIES: hypothetical protein [Morganellaceae]UNH40878.1 hypothetical protein MNY70_16865 [Moellerella wisconsensis]UNH44032.1 hypothetical protein MNY66_16895 [Moellerella wisconsensis]
MVVLARSFFVDAFLDTAIIAAAIQMVAIIFMAVSRHAIKIRMLDSAGGPEAYLAQKIEWPGDPFYTSMVDNCGVRQEFDAWYEREKPQMTIGEFDRALGNILQSTYSIPQETEISDTQFLKLLVIRYAAPFFKWLSIGCLLFGGVAIVLLFNPVNTFREGYPYIALPFSLAVMFHSLRRATQAKAHSMIMDKPLTTSQIDGLMDLAKSFGLHAEFCELLRSAECPNTLKGAHEWLRTKAHAPNTFLG